MKKTGENNITGVIFEAYRRCVADSLLCSGTRNYIRTPESEYSSGAVSFSGILNFLRNNRPQVKFLSKMHLLFSKVLILFFMILLFLLTSSQLHADGYFNNLGRFSNDIQIGRFELLEQDRTGRLQPEELAKGIAESGLALSLEFNNNIDSDRIFDTYNNFQGLFYSTQNPDSSRLSYLFNNLRLRYGHRLSEKTVSAFETSLEDRRYTWDTLKNYNYDRLMASYILDHNPSGNVFLTLRLDTSTSDYVDNHSNDFRDWTATCRFQRYLPRISHTPPWFSYPLFEVPKPGERIHDARTNYTCELEGHWKTTELPLNPSANFDEIGVAWRNYFDLSSWSTAMLSISHDIRSHENESLAAWVLNNSLTRFRFSWQQYWWYNVFGNLFTDYEKTSILNLTGFNQEQYTAGLDLHYTYSPVIKMALITSYMRTLYENPTVVRPDHDDIEIRLEWTKKLTENLSATFSQRFHQFLLGKKSLATLYFSESFLYGTTLTFNRRITDSYSAWLGFGIEEKHYTQFMVNNREEAFVRGGLLVRW